MQSRIAFGVTVKSTPMCGHTYHDTESHLAKTVNYTLRLVKAIATAIIEAHSPYGNKRLAVMIKIRGISVVVFKRKLLAYLLYVIKKYLLLSRSHTAQVIHDCDGALILVGGFHSGGEDLVEVLAAAIVAYLRYKTLHEHSVKAILLHPAEVGVDSRLVI
jgi:hypothetical protein